MANAFFHGGPISERYADRSSGIPVAPPDPTNAPAPSIVTTVAPIVPARPPYGPPDLPPTTIPSVVPTPNIAIAPAPVGFGPSAIFPGLPDAPRPGASVGAFEPVSFGVPQFSADIVERVPPTHATTPSIGIIPGEIPGERMTSPNFPVEHSAPATINAPSLHPNSAASVDSKNPASAPFGSSGTSLADVPVTYAQASYPHRLYDTASTATPDMQAQAPYELTAVIPGSGPAGPTAADAYYFLERAGGPATGDDALWATPEISAEKGEQPTFQPRLSPYSAPAAQPFDPDAIKRDFPILQQQVHGRPLVWLDNAATTQKPRPVIDRLAHFYEYENSNIHRGAHTLAARATDAYEGAREKVRRFLNAPSVEDVIFVRGATEAINLVAQSWGRRNVREGDEIVITWLEHHANIVPWQQLCAEKGAKLRVAPVDDRGQIVLEQYERLLGPRTRIVAISQVSNALGTITPAREMTAMAHRHGARALVDGAQAVPHMAVDVQEIDCDFYVFSGHKVFAPTGIGVLYGKRDVLEHMPPWQGGGNMIADVTFERTIYQGPPERFEAGTGSIADAVGLGAAIDYIEEIGLALIERYEHELLTYATEQLSTIPGLTFIGTAAEKASVLSFVLDGYRVEDVGKALDRDGVAVRAGHHCAQPILRRFGLEATVRPSLAFYNTRADVDALVASLLRLQASRPDLAAG
nr:family 2A encapsulin nanocompartment cargo protein cysteine desulfurase [Methylosinus sp. PW1]